MAGQKPPPLSLCSLRSRGLAFSTVGSHIKRVLKTGQYASPRA
ncbi:MAG: hypothetical protein ACPL4E_08005 [Thermoproteota archaeon]